MPPRGADATATKCKQARRARLVLEDVHRQVLRHAEHERQHRVPHRLVLPLRHEARQHAQAQRALVELLPEPRQVAHEGVLLRRVALQDGVDEAQRAEEAVLLEVRGVGHLTHAGPRVQRARQHRPQQLLHRQRRGVLDWASTHKRQCAALHLR